LDSNQIHDFNPSFGPEVDPNGSNGFGDRTFWTVAADDSAVQVQFGAGTAEMKINNLALDDFGTKANALGPNWQTAFVPAVVSFDVVWSGPITRRLSVTDGTDVDQFTGDYVENQASVTWSGSNANGFTFTANPGNLSTSFDGFAELAHEQNGSFFSDSPMGQQGQSLSGAAVDQLFSRLGLQSGNGVSNAGSAASAKDAAHSAFGEPAGYFGRGLDQSAAARELTNALAGNHRPQLAAHASRVSATAAPFANPLAAPDLLLADL
jgi:hypothetical protein